MKNLILVLLCAGCTVQTIPPKPPTVIQLQPSPLPKGPADLYIGMTEAEVLSLLPYKVNTVTTKDGITTITFGKSSLDFAVLDDGSTSLLTALNLPSDITFH